jgi:hypothetical protein
MFSRSMNPTAARIFRKPAPLLIALGLAILPFVVLSFFNHPQNDDYVLALKTRQLGFWGANAFWFKAWCARYLAVALMSASPVVFGSLAAFKCMAALLIALFAFAAYVLVSAVAPGLAPLERAAGGLAILALHLLQTPDLVEGFYWGSGAVCYELGNALLLLLLGLVLRGHGSADGLPRLRLLAAGLVAAGAAGTNEVTMLLADGFLALYLAARTYRLRRLDRSASLLLAVALLGSAAVMLAPGTRLRFGLSNHPHDLRFAVHESFRLGLSYAWQWLIGGPLIPLCILLAPAAADPARASPGKPLHPALALTLFAGIFFACFFPSLYSTGIMELRTANVVHLYFVVGLLFNAANLAAWFAKRPLPHEAGYPAAVRGILWTAALALTVLPPNNLRTAYADLFSGRAVRYNRDLNARERIIARCALSECEVPPLSARPATIFFFEDAWDEPDGPWFRGYKDAGYAAYHGKAHIYLAHRSESAVAGARADSGAK